MKTICRAAVAGLLLTPVLTLAEIATSDHKEPAVICVLDEVTRKNEVVTVKFRFKLRAGQNATSVSTGFSKSDNSVIVDEEKGVKYFPLVDDNNKPIAQAPESYVRDVERGSSGWMKLPAPPKEVKTVTVMIDDCQPFDDVTITDR
jgi:hypothetical protein